MTGSASESGALARDVYRVVGENRRLGPVARGARWVGTLVAGVIDVGDAPALSDIVFRRVVRPGPRVPSARPGRRQAVHTDLAPGASRPARAHGTSVRSLAVSARWGRVGD